MVLPLLTRLDHVGIACRDLRRAIDMYRETFGLGVLSLEENEEQGVREAMLAVGPSGAGPGSLGVGYIQLLEPLAPDTPVGRFIARRGEGIHHVGYRVHDCAEVLEHVKAEGARVVDEHPRTGSRGTTVAFVHPKGAFGTLIELVEEPAAP